MRRFRYQSTFGLSFFTSNVFWALFLYSLKSLNGELNGEWGTLFDHYGKHLELLKAHRGDVLQNLDDDLILIFDEMRFFQIQDMEPSTGRSEIRCHFYRYPNRMDSWPVLLKKVRRPNNVGVALALAAQFAEKYLPFDPNHCNGRHYMHYILYEELAESKKCLACPLAAPLAGVTAEQIKTKLFKLRDSDGHLHAFLEYALPRKYKWPDWAEDQKRAATAKRRSSCRRTVRRMFAFLGSEKKPESSGEILKQVKLKVAKGQPPLQYRIQIVDKYTVYEAASFMEKHYPNGENLIQALVCKPVDDMYEETESSLWMESLAKGFSVAAFLEDNQGNRGPMIGCNVLDYSKEDTQGMKDDLKETEKVTDPEANIPECRSYLLFQTYKDLRSKVNVFARYKCSSYVRGEGLAVDVGYRGHGIATELILAGGEVSRKLGVPVDATIFSGAASQRIAEKCGYETIAELDLRKYKINRKIVYSNPKTPVIKLMAKRYF